MTAKEVIESTKKEIERIKTKKDGLHTGKWYEGFSFVIKKLYAFMDSFNSVINTPSNIEKAAEEYANNIAFDNEFDKIQCIRDFKAGAKWDSEQGYLMEYELKGRNTIEGLDMDQLKNLGISFGDKVIVQIRKK